MNEWISVKDKLPEKDQIVLISQSFSWEQYEDGAAVTIGRYNGKFWEWQLYREDFIHSSSYDNGIICPGSEYVDAWMPLPEPYKEEI